MENAIEDDRIIIGEYSIHESDFSTPERVCEGFNKIVSRGILPDSRRYDKMGKVQFRYIGLKDRCHTFRLQLELDESDDGK